MKTLSLLVLLVMTSTLYSQNYPWERPLYMAWSNDGTTFNTPTVFQDSSGVPSVVQWKGDTLICAFQWFRIPVASPSWDRVAVKFSYDNGATWTQPTPIVIHGFPSNYQRPFDPTLHVFNSDSIRMYFSSSDGLPMGGLNATVNTYSAKSIDGINYFFEANARVDEPNNRVIDPAVVFFNNAYHYLSPIGSPQQGAYHYVSPNGINFTKVQDIPSDNNHNWTGNYMIQATNELRFYGAGFMGIWFNSTPNGGVWNGFVNTNIQGGDPSVLKISATNYLMVYVGNPYTTGINNGPAVQHNVSVYPNPATDQIHIQADAALVGSTYIIYDDTGKSLLSGRINSVDTTIEWGHLASGLYLLSVGDAMQQTIQIIKR